MTRAAIKGIGTCLPDRVVYNDEIALSLETNDEWIRRNTGITRRYIVGPGEGSVDMAIKAGRAALADSKLDKIDCVIVATSTPDSVMPACAARVQAALGLRLAMSFDLQCACSGFLYGATVANSLIVAGQTTNVLLIGVDTMSKIVDWQDRATCILFGDGAGACVMSSDTSDGRLVLGAGLYSDGSLADILYTDKKDGAGHEVIVMNGRAVFKHAIDKMYAAVIIELEKHSMVTDDIDWIVPHQANIRILDALADRLGVPRNRVVSSIDVHANTSAASIPLALSAAWGKFSKGDLVVLVAVGAGLAWGAMLIRW